MSLFRRAGALVAKIRGSTTDPASAANEVQLYAKDDGGVIKPYVLLSDGTIVLLTGGSGSALTIERLSGDGGVDPSIPLDPTVDVSFISNTGGGETSQDFTLADGTTDGAIHRFVNETMDGTRAVRVTPDNLRGGTFVSTGTNDESFSMIWGGDQGQWCMLGAPYNFTVS